MSVVNHVVMHSPWESHTAATVRTRCPATFLRIVIRQSPNSSFPGVSMPFPVRSISKTCRTVISLSAIQLWK